MLERPGTHNTDPAASEPAPPARMPSAQTLRRASLAAVGVAALITVGVVLPAETTRDPIGLGKRLGLAEMGQLKAVLAAEAAAETAEEAMADSGAATAAPIADVSPERRASGSDQREPGDTPPGTWRDSVTFTLAPGGTIELKLAMQEGERAVFAWETDGADVYYNTHGEPPNAPRGFSAHTYERGSAASDNGELVAVYEGIHGWFWRNRSDSAVTITLRTRGEYLELREIP